MAILDFPVGDGDGTKIQRLVRELHTTLSSDSEAVATLFVASEEEADWIVGALETRGLAFDSTVVVHPADPLLTVRRIADPEYNRSLYRLAAGSLLLIQHVHNIDASMQRDFVDFVSSFCVRRRARALITASAPIAGDFNAFRAPEFPSDRAARKTILMELFRAALARESASAADDAMSRVVDHVAELPLPRGFWQADEVLSHVARGLRGGLLELPDAVISASAASNRSPVPPITVAELRAELARLDAGLKLLNKSLNAVAGVNAFDLGHLPRNPELCSSPSHWFEAVVTRWYAFYFDGGPRIKFLSRIRVRPNGDLIHLPRAASPVPELLRSLRTWQVHGLDPTAARAQQQRAETHSWFSAKCGNASPAEYHWRGLTVALIAELKQYIAQLVRATQNLAQYRHLIDDMNHYVASAPAREWK